MTQDVPYWVKQRQAKVEELATATFRLTGPNLQEGIVEARIGDDLHWQAVLRAKADGPEVAASPPQYDNPRDALAAAFELYRTHFVI